MSGGELSNFLSETQRRLSHKMKSRRLFAGGFSFDVLSVSVFVSQFSICGHNHRIGGSPENSRGGSLHDNPGCRYENGWSCSDRNVDGRERPPAPCSIHHGSPVARPCCHSDHSYDPNARLYGPSDHLYGPGAHPIYLDPIPNLAPEPWIATKHQEQ